MHWIDAQFCVGMFLDSTDKYLNMFQNLMDSTYKI